LIAIASRHDGSKEIPNACAVVATSMSIWSKPLLLLRAEGLDGDLPVLFVRLDLDVRIALRLMDRT